MFQSGCLDKTVATRTNKNRLNDRLKAAATHRDSGQFDQARRILSSLVDDPDAVLLGHKTSLGLPRRLQSALLKLAKAEKDTVKSVGYQYHLVPPPALLASFTQFSSAHRKAVVEANRRPVPRKIHQIWISTNAQPVGTKAWQAHADAQGYEYQLWDENQLNELGLNQNPVYTDMLLKGDFPGAVDVARYVILEKFGGVYLDCDWYPTRNDLSFQDFVPLLGLTAMAEATPRRTGKDGTLLANSVIAAPPHHPVLTRLVTALNDVMTVLPDAPAWWATGPLIFTLIARGGSISLVDAHIVAGQLPQDTPLEEVERWCREAKENDLGLFLAWKSWIWR